MRDADAAHRAVATSYCRIALCRDETAKGDIRLNDLRRSGQGNLSRRTSATASPERLAADMLNHMKVGGRIVRLTVNIDELVQAGRTALPSYRMLGVLK